MPPRRDPLPPQALAWLLGTPRDVLLLGPTRALSALLTAAGHRVTACDPALAALARLAHDDHPPRLVCARGDALPVRPHLTQTICVAQHLHTLDPRRCFGEFARALVTGGTLAVVYTTRDDTVPWVRRLAALLQAVDPTAMQGGYGAESADRLHHTHYFNHVEHEAFRTWVPISRDGLTAMVAKRPAVAALPDDERAALLTEVASFYDGLARGPEPLLLPYQADCWRATVNHDEMSVPISLDEGLRLLDHRH